MKSRPELTPVTDGYPLLLVLYLLLRAWFGASLWWLALLHTFALYLFLPLIGVLLLALDLRKPRATLVAFALLILGVGMYFPLPKRAPQRDAHELRVIQFNAMPRNPRLAEAAQWIVQQNPDVVVLEEIVAEDYEPALEVLYRTYPHQACIQSSIRLFSRYPLLEHETVWIEEPGPNHGRLALRTVVDAPGQPVAVYGVHLTLPWQDEPHFPIETHHFFLNVVLRYDETRRNAQIRDLLARVQAEPYPVILAGDFNTSHTSPTYNEFLEAGLYDAFGEVGRGWGMTWPAGRDLLPPLLRLDYIWHTVELHALRARLGPNLGSDHLPVIVDFALRKTGVSGRS